MSGTWEQKNEQAEGAFLKTKRFVAQFTIKKHATPASKVLGVDFSELIAIRAQGQTAAADAIDAGGSFTSALDSTGIFGLILHNLNDVEKVLKTSITASTGTVAVVGSGVTASKNIYLDLDSDQDLSADNSTTLTFTLDIVYRIKN